MTTNRGRMLALDELVQLQTAGGFDLPAELLAGVEMPHRVSALPLPKLPDETVQRAANRLLADLERDRTPDLAGYAEQVVNRTHESAVQNQASAILTNAAEHAQALAVNLAADLADRVITDHLRPACDAVLEQVERHGSVLAGQSLDPRALITAPAKVRTAWSAMQALAERYQALRMARGKANTAGLRTPKHDADGLFAAFAEPFAVNGYRPGNGRQAPRPEVPEDPVDRMRWLAGPAKALRPWLPTVEEQDAACWVIYGPLFEQRQTAAVFARGVVAGRGPALPTSAA